MTSRAASRMDIIVKQIDYNNPQMAADFSLLMNEYAKDPMGANAPLDDRILSLLLQKLADFPTAFTLIAYVDDQPAGIANCFLGFSTFTAKPLINIHDLAVRSKFRGMGLSRIMMNEVETIAREKECGRITLEVSSNNRVAIAAYKKFGFEGNIPMSEAESTFFLRKKLD